MICPVLDFPVQMSHGHAGESLVKDHDKEDEAPLLWEQTESWGFSGWRREGSGGNLISVCVWSAGGELRKQSQIQLITHCQDKPEPLGTKWNAGRFFESDLKNPFDCDGCQT